MNRINGAGIGLAFIRHGAQGVDNVLVQQDALSCRNGKQGLIGLDFQLAVVDNIDFKIVMPMDVFIDL